MAKNKDQKKINVNQEIHRVNKIRMHIAVQIIIQQMMIMRESIVKW